MGNPAGMKRDFDALEKRRLKALRLFQKRSLNLAEVARRLAVSRQTVSRWMTEFRAGGEKALQKAGRAGRRPELTEGNRAVLECLLASTPMELDIETSVWTCRSVAALIEQEFGIKYHPGHVWRILNEMGWTRQQQPKSSPDGAAGRKRRKDSHFQGSLDTYDRKQRKILEKMGRTDLISLKKV
jgi:transposase